MTGSAATSTRLMPTMALAWCSGVSCALQRPEHLVEANGVSIPYGVKMKRRTAGALVIPAGVSVN